MYLLNIVLYASMASAYVAIIYSLFKLKTFSTILKVFFVYFLFSAISDFVCLQFVFRAMDNSIIFMLFAVVQSVLFLFAFRLALPGKSAGYFVYSCVAISICTVVFSIYTFLTKGEYLYWPTLVYHLPLIGLSLFRFYKFLQDLDTPKLTSDTYFWINSGILFYFSVTAISCIFEGLTRTHSFEFALPIMLLDIGANLVFNLIVIVGLTKWKAPETSSENRHIPKIPSAN